MPSLAALAVLFVVYAGSAVVFGRALGITNKSLRSLQLTAPMVETQLLGYIPVLIYLTLVLPALARRSLREILGRFGARELLAGLGGAILMWLAVATVGALEAALLGHTPNQLAVRLFERAHPGLLLDLMIAVAVLVAPFAEELVFRGFIFNAIRVRASFPVAATLSGLLFGAAHGEAAGILPLAAGGFVLASVYARTGSLWSSIVAHGSFNGFTLLLLLSTGIKT
ncbi:MAG: CPBP family intramembrane metalloprotease [Candidatus Eremiobacteraeota bacterium]|nr:CPBP family intramembrane metalloprotease [Candidatus Eremiobacteraeota bacterium]